MGQTTSRVDSVRNQPPNAGCPIPHDQRTEKAQSSSSGCPISHDQRTETSVDSTPKGNSKAGQCPIDHEAINPLNQMPTLAQTPAQNQSVQLPTQRTESSIPRDSSAKWEYPSPQQFYNALIRKGWETPEEHVETMVEIHNFLNEEAWEEVLKWERRHNKYPL